MTATCRKETIVEEESKEYYYCDDYVYMGTDLPKPCTEDTDCIGTK